jgi:hypothetical protein
MNFLYSNSSQPQAISSVRSCIRSMGQFLIRSTAFPQAFDNSKPQFFLSLGALAINSQQPD